MRGLLRAAGYGETVQSLGLPPPLECKLRSILRLRTMGVTSSVPERPQALRSLGPARPLWRWLVCMVLACVFMILLLSEHWLEDVKRSFRCEPGFPFGSRWSITLSPSTYSGLQSGDFRYFFRGHWTFRGTDELTTIGNAVRLQRRQSCIRVAEFLM